MTAILDADIVHDYDEEAKELIDSFKKDLSLDYEMDIEICQN